MNTIYEKSRTKRKYRKLPPCGHRNQICDMEHCRLQYAIKEPKGTIELDRHLLRREKSLKILRNRQDQKLDKENWEVSVFNGSKWIPIENEVRLYTIKGEFAKRKALKAKYRRNLWKSLFIFIGLVALYPIVIVIIDIFYGK